MAKRLNSLKQKVFEFMSNKNDNEQVEETLEQNIAEEVENATDAVNENMENQTANEPEEEKSELELLADENEKLKQETGELKDKYLRLFAEFDNYKKRTSKERMELFKTAGKDIIVQLLPVLDDFERAINNETVSDGFELIYKKLKQNLEAKGLKKMDCKEQAFDVELHEAITEIPAPTDELKGKVVDVIEDGYTLNDKIIRYAKVVVGK